MIDFNSEFVSALRTVLPTHYELALTSDTTTPCISYQERNNYASEVGDTLGYSVISYTVKIWDHEIEVIQSYAQDVDKVLRPLGFKRISSQELHDPNSTMIQKILTYEALASEQF